jgi:sulfur-oxidizing protein SoxX
VPYEVVGDAIAQPLASAIPDPARGRAIVLDRRIGNCLICHHVPDTSERFQGNLGPDLAGVGRRLTPGQIRLRLVDQRRINPASVMPPYYRVTDLRLVAEAYRGKPVLKAEEIEDVVAYLAGLKD